MVTAREFPLAGISSLTPRPIAYGNVEGDRTTITKIEFVQTSGNWLFGVTPEEFPKTTVIDGVTYRWTINETGYDAPLNTTTIYVKRATLNIGTRLTINKPFFGILWGANNEFTYDFSFYDLGRLDIVDYQQNEITDMFEIDGRSPITMSIYEKDGLLGTDVTPDAVYRFTWALGNKSYTLTKRTAANASSLSATYTPPADWCTEINPALYATMTVKVEAVFGTFVYQDLTDWISVHVPDNFVPVINNIKIADTKGRVPAAWGMFIQDNSNISIQSMDVSTAYGAAITSVEMKVLGKTYAGTMSYLPKTDTVTEYGVIDVEVTVKDRRQRKTTKTAQVTFVEYKPPTLQVDSPRCDESGDIENDGTYFLAQTVTTYSTCNGKNSLTLTMRYKITSDKVYTKPAKTLPIGTQQTICGGDCDPEFSYDVEYVIKDALNTIVIVDYVTTGLYLIHFLHGGRGVAFGNKATMENYADFAFNALFRGSATFTKDTGEEVTIQQIINKLGL